MRTRMPGVITARCFHSDSQLKAARIPCGSDSLLSLPANNKISSNLVHSGDPRLQKAAVATKLSSSSSVHCGEMRSEINYFSLMGL